MDSPNLKTVEELWDVLERDGLAASLEMMLLHCHQDVELKPYSADGRTLRGAEEIRRFFREAELSGAAIHASPWSFEERDDEVIVSGSIRVHRADGSIADSQLRWIYSFRDGLIQSAASAPLTAAPAVG